MKELTSTNMLRFVLRDETVVDPLLSTHYKTQQVQVLQQYWEPSEKYIGIVQGEWRDVPLFLGDD